MNEQANLDLVRRFYETAFIRHDMPQARMMMAQNYKLHDPSMPDMKAGPMGWSSAQEVYLKAIPDHHLTILRQLVDGEFVVTHWKTEGTQKGDLPHLPASGKRFSITGISISRVVDGKIAEEWQNWDTLGLVNQLTGEVTPMRRAA